MTHILPRLAAALAATTVAATGFIIAAPHAQAADQLYCAEWGQYGYEDKEGTYVIVAFCTHWNSGGGTSEPAEPTPTPSIPKGVEPPDVPDPVSCDDLAALETKLNERIADDRKQAIAGEITVSADEVAKNAARRDLDDAAADATNAVAAEAAAQEAYARAVGGYYYREVIRYGKELLIKAPYPRGEIDQGIAEGQALLDAMDAVSHALQDEHAAQYDYQHAAATWAADKQALDALYDEIARLEQQLQDIARDKETCTK